MATAEQPEEKTFDKTNDLKRAEMVNNQLILPQDFSQLFVMNR